MIRKTMQLMQEQLCGNVCQHTCSRSLATSRTVLYGRSEEVPVHQGYHESETRERIDPNYRSPTEKVWPASPRQQKVGSRVLRALEITLSEPKYLQTLVKEYGLCLEEVRMSPDMLVAYVLWSAHPEYEQQTQQELRRQLSKIRMGLGRALKARNVPRLEFRFNQMSASQAAVEQEFERIAKLEGD